MRHVHLMIVAGVLAAVMFSAGSALAEEKGKTAVKADDKVGKMIPRSMLKELEKYFGKPAGKTHKEMMKNFIVQVKKAIKHGAKIEKKYPKAENLYEVWMVMLKATVIMNNSEAEKGKHTKQIASIATKILKSNAPAEMKVIADLLMTQAAVKNIKQADVREKKIRAYIAKYAKTSAAADAYIFAAQIALENGPKDFANTLADEMEKKFPKNRKVKAFLKQAMGRSPHAGKVFAANMTRLDGSKLILPKDLKGKVVVIDFWALWCAPCRTSIPHLKQVYAKYKSRGVEIVGISLDKDRKALEKYVQEQGIDWIVTFSGKSWNDPTARKYGVSGIPSIWVIGKDGRVFSSNARGNLEATIDRALKADVK